MSDTPWRDAVLDARTVLFLAPDPDQDPRKALAELIEWNCKVALDPKVSGEARDLVRETVERACRAVCEHCDSGGAMLVSGRWYHGHRGGPVVCRAESIRREFEEVLRG